MYGDKDQVRILVGNPPDTGSGSISDAAILDKITFADQYINARTGLTNWPNTDPNYPLIQRLSNLLAASAILENDSGRANLFSQYRSDADNLITVIVANIQGVTGRFIVSVSPYMTQPLNPNAAPYISKNGPRIGPILRARGIFNWLQL